MTSFAGTAAAAALALVASTAHAAPVPCVNGNAGGYPCDKVDMLARIPLSLIGGDPSTPQPTGSDVWGWTDLSTGKEYAIVALSNSTSFVDISDPVNPVYLGRLLAPLGTNCVPSPGQPAAPVADRPDHEEECQSPLPDTLAHPITRMTGSCSNSLWRDIEVYNDHAFIGSEQGGHGLVVFDLRLLRNVPSPPVTFNQTARFCGYGNSHTTTINTTTGFLYANGSGSNTCGGDGRPVIVNIQNPAVPVFAGCNTAGGYTHDSQCFVYQGPDVAHQNKSICINSNGSNLVVDDVSNPAATVRLSSRTYTGVGYVHQGWITADHRYFMLDDEFDEENLGGNTRTYIWDMSDLDAPVLIGTHFGTTPAIDHQQFVHGNFTYQSNYRAGLRILENQNVAAGQLAEVGYFDVYPPDDNTAYGGTWAHYPFFHSGNVPITTIGPPYGTAAAEFFVLRPLFADLEVTVTDSPDPVPLNQDVTYTFTVTNQGPTYSSSTTLVDALPASMVYVSATASQGSCTGTTTVTCNLGRLEHDGSATVTIVARATVLGPVSNAGVVSAAENDTRAADNTATAQTTVTQAAQTAEPSGLVVDAAGNRVLQPNEGAVVVAPSWRNTGTAAITLSGAAAGFTGPAGPTYTTVDGTGAYPSLAPGSSAPCTDCYSFSIAAGARPATHWDSTFQETVNPSSTAKTWTLHVGNSFGDVPPTSPFFRFVETMLHRAVTGGCTTSAFCPGSSTTREQMAVFALVSKEGSGYVPPACVAGSEMFVDLPASNPFCRWVEELARRGVVGGCGSGRYCPAVSVVRDQMAIFALRTLEGAAYTPPACGTPMYADVPASSPFCRWIEELTRRGVVSGCGGGNYCPAVSVSREQMSVFLTLTFGLTLYGL